MTSSPIRIRRSPARRAALLALTVLPALTIASEAEAQKQDSIVAHAAQAIAPLRDAEALRKAGFSVIGFATGSKDLTPFQGQHWIAFARFIGNQEPDVSKPVFMMYLPLGDSLVPIGVAYAERIIRRPVPTELDGVPLEWHLHAICSGVPGEGNVIADGRADCIARGGTPSASNIAMVHAWTVPNPDGPYAHDNPALPFIATGLEPPSRATSDDRLFAIALGETYGAKLVVAHHIDDLAARAGTNQRLLEKRAALKALVPQLRDAHRANDTRAFDALRKKTIDAWTALAAEYRAAAPTPEMKARFDVELNEALGTMHHHM